MKVWAKIGLLSFGGPAGQIALMHKELVEERRWIGEQRFLHALNYCMLLPGPEAQQLAIYIGWLLHRTIGGLVAGILFVVPGALVMLVLSILYVLYGDVPLVEALFFGVKAAVLAIVIEAVIRIGRRALKNRVMVSIARRGLHRHLCVECAVSAHHPARGPDRVAGKPHCSGPVFRLGTWQGRCCRYQGSGRPDVRARRVGPPQADEMACAAHCRDLAADLARACSADLVAYRLCKRLDRDRPVLQSHGGRHLRRRLCGACLCRAGSRPVVRLARPR